MAAGVPSTNSIYGPMNLDSLQRKTKIGAPMELPGIFYNQYVPTAATLTSGTVTNNGQSLIGALQLGGGTATTLPFGGDAVVTFSSSTGLLCSFTTSSFMPTTLNYDQFPVQFVPASGAVLPTGILANTIYYAQWVSATTVKLAATPNGSVIPYTNAGSGTIYCQAAPVGFWGSPWLPAGALAASDTLNFSSANSVTTPGSSYRIEVYGHKIGATTNNYVVSSGLVSGAGTWTQLIGSGNMAAIAVGPFPFKIVTDIYIQQYGQTAVTSPYTAIAMIKTMQEVTVYGAAGGTAGGTGNTVGMLTLTNPITTKVVSLDVTQPYAFDVRYLAATPAVGEYMEPLWVRMWAFN